MAVAALVVWLLTAFGGATMATVWLRAGGTNRTLPEPTEPVAVPGAVAARPGGDELPADYTTAINLADPPDPAEMTAPARPATATGPTSASAPASASASAPVRASAPSRPAVDTRLTPALVFGHATLAGAGLVLWLAYVVSGARPVAWLAFVLLLVVIGVGEIMFLRWFGARAGAEPVIENRFPAPLVYGHGVGGMATVVLVLLAALGVGGS